MLIGLVLAASFPAHVDSSTGSVRVFSSGRSPRTLRKVRLSSERARHEWNPALVSMDGNKMKLTSPAASVLFDLNGDGAKERTGWPMPGGGDGFPALDRNLNGRTTTASPLVHWAARPDRFGFPQDSLSFRLAAPRENG